MIKNTKGTAKIGNGTEEIGYSYGKVQQKSENPQESSKGTVEKKH